MLEKHATDSLLRDFGKALTLEVCTICGTAFINVSDGLSGLRFRDAITAVRAGSFVVATMLSSNVVIARDCCMVGGSIPKVWGIVSNPIEAFMKLIMIVKYDSPFHRCYIYRRKSSRLFTSSHSERSKRN